VRDVLSGVLNECPYLYFIIRLTVPKQKGRLKAACCSAEPEIEEKTVLFGIFLPLIDLAATYSPAS
jgi:hypothetical protein